MEPELNHEQRIVTLESNLERAALLGKHLLEQLSLKTSECDDLVERCTRYEVEIDTLKQRFHTAEKEAQLVVARESNALKEIDCLKSVCTKYEILQEEHRTLQEKSRILEFEKQRKSQNVTELEEHLVEVRTELSRAKNQIEELKIFEKRREDPLEQLATLSTENQNESDLNERLNLEVGNLQKELHNLRALLEQTVIDKELVYKKNLQAENRLEEALDAKSSLEQELAFRLNVVNEKNQLISELKDEIEELKVAETDPNRRGNSIFSEVEDRRLEVEAKLVEAQARLRAADECRRRLKTQLAQCYTSLQIMAAHSSKADQNYVKTLEMEVIRLRTDLASVSIKLTASKSGDEVYTEKDLHENPLAGLLLTERRQVASLKKMIETLSEQGDQRTREILRLGSDLRKCQSDTEALEKQRTILLMKLKEKQISGENIHDVTLPETETINEVLVDVLEENSRVKHNEQKLLASNKVVADDDLPTSVASTDETFKAVDENRRDLSSERLEHEKLPVKAVNFTEDVKPEQPKQTLKVKGRQVEIKAKTNSGANDCKTQ